MDRLAAFRLAMLFLPGLLLAAPDASAQAQRGSRPGQNEQLCRSQCQADYRQTPGASATSYQACMIRCQAGQQFTAANTGRGINRAGPNTATGLGTNRAAPNAATGLGNVPTPPGGNVPMPPLGNVPMPSNTPPRPGAATAAMAGAAGAGAYAMASPPRPSFGAIYVTPAPGAVAGLSVGQTDRLAAHRLAESACLTLRSGACRLMSEFTARCGAVVEAFRRSPGSLFMTSDRSTQQVLTLAQGSGPTQADAESNAMADCSRREPSAQCRVSLSACGPG